jgi:hypothetical protein
MKIHNLKTWPGYFQFVFDGIKTFELRQDDRGFEIGDILHLQEYEPETKTYSGRYVDALVTYMLGGFEGISEGWVCMAIKIVNAGKEEVK